LKSASRARLSRADFEAVRRAILDLYWHRDLAAFERAAPRILSALLQMRRFRFVGVALEVPRKPTEPDLTRREQRLLQLALPHVDVARRNAERVTEDEATGASALAAFGLTSRETQVAHQLSLGRANAEIAFSLNIRPRTVEKHVEIILAKLGVENRTAAAMIIARSRDRCRP
jgi:DNA-binding CsgD family transcriptional regulator